MDHLKPLDRVRVRRSNGSVEDCWHLMSDLSTSDPFKAPEQLYAKVGRAVDADVDLREQDSAGAQLLTKHVSLLDLLKLNPPS